MSKRAKLIADIAENLERQHNNLGNELPDIISDKKKELEDLRGKKIGGAMLRSCAKWLDTGENHLPSS